MSRKQSPLFLERRSYRLRRIIDAARLLPVVGGVLWAVPMLWAAEAGRVTTSQAMLYLFLVWMGLVGVTLILSFWLKESAESDNNDGG